MISINRILSFAFMTAAVGLPVPNTWANPADLLSTAVNPATTPTQPGPSFVPTTIDFEGLSGGTIVTNQFPEAIFSTTTLGRDVTVIDGNFSPQGVRSICPLDGDCDGNVIVDFPSPVVDLTFLANSDGGRGPITVDVYTQGVFDAQVMFPTDGVNETNELVDLSWFSNVTRIEINQNDPAGLLYDLFSFEVVPEPSSMILGTIGFLCVGWFGWRRRRKAA